MNLIAPRVYFPTGFTKEAPVDNLELTYFNFHEVSEYKYTVTYYLKLKQKTFLNSSQQVMMNVDVPL